MTIKVDAAPSGYSIVFEFDDGATNTYPGECHNLLEAIHYAEILADECGKETGVKPETLVSFRAIKENRHRDIHARKAWDSPPFLIARARGM